MVTSSLISPRIPRPITVRQNLRAVAQSAGQWKGPRAVVLFDRDSVQITYFLVWYDTLRLIHEAEVGSS